MFTNTFIREVRRLLNKSCSKATATPPAAIEHERSRNKDSHSGMKLNCLLSAQQQNVTPLLARKSPSSSECAAVKNYNQQLVAHDIIYAACAVAISPHARTCLTSDVPRLQRHNTPPHISQGRGNKPVLDATMLL